MELNSTKDNTFLNFLSSLTREPTLQEPTDAYRSLAKMPDVMRIMWSIEITHPCPSKEGNIHYLIFWDRTFVVICFSIVHSIYSLPLLFTFHSSLFPFALSLYFFILSILVTFLLIYLFFFAIHHSQNLHNKILRMLTGCYILQSFIILKRIIPICPKTADREYPFRKLNNR
jgi:hypothetical protein